MTRKLGGSEDKYRFFSSPPLSLSALEYPTTFIQKEIDSDFLFFQSFISYRTGHYKLHYYETPTSLKFVMVTDTKTNNLRIVLHQIYVSLYVEYGMYQQILYLPSSSLGVMADLERVVKNPLSPIEHPGGVGVNCELFELGLEQFVVSQAYPLFGKWR